MLTDIVWKTTVEWYAGNIVCKIVRYCQVRITHGRTASNRLFFLEFGKYVCAVGFVANTFHVQGKYLILYFIHLMTSIMMLGNALTITA